MRIFEKLIVTGCAACRSLVAQDVPDAVPALTFEVASVRKAPPLYARPALLPRRVDPQQATYRNALMMNLLTEAWGVKRYQIRGPQWLDNEYYDIVAKLPSKSAVKQIPVMLQALLIERFKIQFHKENGRQRGYVLIADKEGHRLQPSMAVELPRNADGQVSIADMREADRSGKAVAGIRIHTGSGQIRMGKVTMGMLADGLSGLMACPVVDMTGIAGEFDLTFQVSAGDVPGRLAEVIRRSDDSVSVFTSIRKLGLKLESRDLPVEYLVIDRAEPEPTPN
jgi:uncharacterized protein (TIGR03435 family)